MGGNLFHLPRMPRAQYLEREAAVRACLDRKLGGAYRIPRFYGDKADFGDMDVIVPDRPDWGALRAEIAADLGVIRVKTAGRVFSMDYDGLQTDLFAVAPQFVESTYAYMSFNDLGNLLGRLLRPFNLKYGEEGLAYVFRRASDERYKVDLPITQDFARICAFAGLDHAAWVEGFDTLAALYEWVIASPYFSVRPYLDGLAGTMARRSPGRPTINTFIDYLRERGVTARPAFAGRETYLPVIAAAFPDAGLAGQIAAERALEERAMAIAAKFSGKLVMSLRPELSGKELGVFIVAFKRSYGDFEAFALDAPPEEIERRILAFQVNG
jgi:hypothetical protein